MDESVIKELERPVSEKPLLSHAIREGAKLLPQCYGRAFGRINEDGRFGSCAIGAAIHHATGIPWDPVRQGGIPAFLRDTFGLPFSNLKMIIDMNDQQRMTREAIADVVEQWGF